MPRIVESAPNRIVISNMITTYGGIEPIGLPPSTSGQSYDMYSVIQAPMAQPAIPPISVNIRTGLTGCSSASSISCRGMGEYTVKSVWPAGGRWRSAGSRASRHPRLAALRRGQHLFHLGDRHRREVLHEQQEPHEEPAEAPCHDAPVRPRGIVRRVGEPLERLARERHDDDHEALEPHPDIHEDRDHEQRQDARADVLAPQQPRQEPVADVHGPAGPPERPEGPIPEGGALVGITT